MRQTATQAPGFSFPVGLLRVNLRHVMTGVRAWLRPRSREDEAIERLAGSKWTDSAERDISYGIMSRQHRF